MFGFGNRKEKPVETQPWEAVEKPISSRQNLNGKLDQTKRMKQRRYRGKRGYDAAKNTRFMSKWPNSPSPINFQITSMLHVLVARSREAFQNNDHIKRAVSLRKSKIVGHTGIRFVPKVKTNGKIDKEINDQIAQLVKAVSKRGVLDAKGRLSLIDIQNRVEHQLFVDGEYLCIHKYNKMYDFGYAIDEVDPMLLPVDMNLDLKNGNIIRCGIELDKNRRRVAYHFIKETKHTHPSLGQYHFRDNTVRIPASRVTHYFVQEFPDQMRGVPKAATALFRVEVLRKYIEAELIGARVGASSAGFFVRHKDYFEPYDGTGDIDVTDEDDEDIDRDDAEDMEIDEVEAGTVKIAPVGYDFKSWDLNRPNSAFADFIKENTRAMASSTDTNYSALSNNYENVSYSSLRDSNLTDEEIEKQGQVFLTEHFMEDVVPRAIESAIDFGYWQIKDRKPRFSVEYTEGEYIPKVRKWVDPVKEAQAYRILNRDLMVLSRERIARSLGILNPDEEFDVIKLENEKFPLHNDTTPTPTSDKEKQEDDIQASNDEK